jgi:hypothetical protein
MRRITLQLLWLSITVPLFASQAHAASIDYLMVLRVTSISQIPGCVPGFGSFGCNNMVGDIHIGTFSIDSALLQQTGDNPPGSISNFLLEIGSVVWAHLIRRVLRGL